MYEPSAGQRHLAMVTLASGLLAVVAYGLGVDQVATGLVAVAVASAVYLLYLHGQRRGGGGDGGDDERRRREKQMEAEVGGSGGNF